MPNMKLTIWLSESVTGRMILGNRICLISDSLPVMALVELPAVAVNHLKGTIALSRKSGKSGVERWKMTVITSTYTSIVSSGSSTHQTLPSTVLTPRFLTSARTI